MKKTLIITLEFPPQIGGIATYIHDLAKSFEKDKVVVLAPKMKGGKEWDEMPDYKIIRKKLLWPKFIWPRWFRLLRQVFWIVRQEKIELIMVHHVLPVGYIAVVIKKILRVPFLLFSHGTDLVAGTGTRWKRKMVKLVAHQSEQVIFNSESLKGRFLSILPEFKQKSLVFYPCPSVGFLNPPDEVELEALRNRLALQGKKVILSISRLDEGKGFPHFAQALPQILLKSPHVVWLVVGGGPKKDMILSQVQKLGLQNVTRFVGEVSHAELNKYYYLADLFVLFTHPDEGKEEGLGLVFLEAAAAGLPIVAGRSGGVEEAVLHTQTGIVLDIRTQKNQIVESIVELLSNKSYADRLGQAGKERIKANFKWETQIKKIAPWLQ